MHRPPISFAAIAGVIAAAVACSGSPDRPPPAGTASFDAGNDGGPTTDASSDSGPVATGVIVSASTFSNWEAETQVAIAPNGDVFVVWIALNLGGQNSIAFAVSHDGGKSFSMPDVVPSASGARAVDPSVAVDTKGVFHITWLELATTRHVMSATYLGDISFTIPTEVSDPVAPGAWDKPAIVAQDDGSLLVVCGTENGSTLVVAKSTDGKSWTRTTLAPDATPRNIASACTSGAHAYITSLIPSGVELVRSNDSGATWSSPVRVDMSGSGAAFEPPSCAARGSDVWIAYGTGGGGGSETETPLLDELWVAQSSDGGASIATRARVSEDPGLHYLLPLIARDPKGKLALAYYVAPGAGAQGSFRVRFSEDGETWSTPTTVRSPISMTTGRAGFDWLGDYVGVAVSGGVATLAFADNTSIAGAALSRIRVAHASVR